ncbi:MAG: adenylate/guanylate cyclase domain-containing protein [Stellaceae bacterium]
MAATCRLAALLTVDVVGYSHLMGAGDESSLILAATRRLADRTGYSGLIRPGAEGVLERLKAYRRELIDPKIAEYHGRVVKTTGEGMLVEFLGAVEAVRCAVEMQQAVIRRNANTVEDARLSFRVGVDLAIINTDDIKQDGNIGTIARLEALAKPGGVCISRAVRDLIADKLPYTFGDIGESTLENLAGPMRAYAMSAHAVASTLALSERQEAPSAHRRIQLRSVVITVGIVATIGIWIVAGWAWFGGNPSTAPIQRPVAATPQTPPVPGTAGDKYATTPAARSLPIVFLPFSNLSDDPDQEYFADGITEDLTTDFSRIPGSLVIARTTAFTYKGKSMDARQVGSELGIRYVLAGSVQRAGEQVRLNVVLIDAENGTRLWIEQADTDRTSLADAEEKIIGGLARTLKREDAQALAGRSEPNRILPEARDLIMRGRAWLHRPYSAATWQEAQTAFERALEIDSRSVEARISLAKVLGGKLADGWSNSRQQDPARAEQLLEEALERDANSSTAHFAMGLLRRMQNRLPEAQREYEMAIALDPNDARALYQLGATLMFLGHPEAGIPHIEKAIRLNPNDPEMTPLYWALGTCYLLLGHIDEAIDFLGQARAANSRIWYPHLYLAGAFGLRGDIDAAKSALVESVKLNPKINSLARMRLYNAWVANPQNWALQDQTLNVGLRRAGLPDE